MKTQILKTWLVMFVVLLMMGGLTRADPAGMEEVFFDDFDDGNFDGWSATHPTTGDPATPPDVVLSPEGYSLRGVGSGYSHDPGLNVLLTRPLLITNVGELKIEMRAKSGPQWPNQAKVQLFSGSDYYSGTAYGEGNQTAWFRSGINGVEYDHLYSINANVWHDFAWTRDADGWWSLSIDGQEVADFPQDDPLPLLTSFDQVTLHILRNQSEIEWVRISGVREAVPVEWKVADGGNGHYYERVDVPGGITWPDAKDAAESCTHLGVNGYLATITSSEEQSFIFDNLLVSAQSPQYWLGGFQSPFPGGSWQWITGEEWSYSNWWVTEPSGDGYALEIKSSSVGPPTGPGTWNDEPATHLLGGYIIEYSVPEPTVPEMVLIPGGEFDMGDHLGDGGDDELPVHTVTVDSFFMGKFEITNQQYCDYLNSAILAGDIKVDDGIVYDFKDTGYNYPYCDTHSADTDSQIDYSGGVFSVRTKSDRDMLSDPIVNVRWFGAAAYCNWRSQQEGYQVLYDPFGPNCDFSKNGYRLPTEAEWEYAARGGNHSPYYRFPWGDTISHSQANYRSYVCLYDISPTRDYHPTWNDGVYPYTSPVGSFSANGYGLYDMAGNVSEWCNDWYDSNYYDYSPTSNPTGPINGTCRVLRGGGWRFVARRCLVAHRSYTWPVYRFHGPGFRVVRKPEPPATYHVDNANGSDDNDGHSPETAFATINKGIEAAEDGDTVLVWPGVYTEEVRFRKKAVTVRSAADAALIQNPDDFAVSFYYGEGRGSVLKNFVIANSLTGIFIAASSPTISNVTVVNNAFGIEAYAGSEPDISISIFRDNTESDLFQCQAMYSCIERENGGESNIYTDPLFVDSNNSNYHLLSERGRYWPEHDIWVLDEVTSPCIDAGDPDADFSAERNPNGGRINIGAYGGTYYASMSKWWPCGDVNRNGEVNWEDFAIVAENWLLCRPGGSEQPALPSPASNPDPYSGATGISTSPVLSWQGGAGATSHGVYFGDTPPGVFQGNQTQLTFSPGTLSESAIYFWRIEEVNAHGKTPGPIWTFTTKAGAVTTGR